MGFMVQLPGRIVYLSRYQFKKLCGTHRLSWLCLRPNQVLGKAMALRWGFNESIVNRAAEALERKTMGLPPIPKGFIRGDESEPVGRGTYMIKYACGSNLSAGMNPSHNHEGSI